jgi:hypothetical protein
MKIIISEQQRKKIDDYEKDFRKILPALESMKNSNKQVQNILLLAGR